MEKKYKMLYKSYNYIVEFGLEKFSLNGLLDHLKISKGNFYYYFSSKDEMILEIFEHFTLVYIEENQKRLKFAISLKEKLKIIFETYLDDSKENKEFLAFYKEFILSKRYSEALKKYTQRFHVYFIDTIKSILKDEIEKGKVKPEALNFTTAIVSIADGILIYDYTLEEICLKNELTNFIDFFVNLVEIKG